MKQGDVVFIVRHTSCMKPQKYRFIGEPISRFLGIFVEDESGQAYQVDGEQVFDNELDAYRKLLEWRKNDVEILEKNIAEMEKNWENNNGLA